MPFGIVTQTKAGFVKVDISAFEYETDWIPVINLFSGTNNSQFNIPLNTQVFIIDEFDKNGELMNQVCVGATNNDEDPSPFSKTKDGIKWSDGTEISYDTVSKKITINAASNIDLTGVTVNIGTAPAQASVSLLTLYTFLNLVNVALGKIPTPPTGAEIAALNAALQALNVGVPSVKIPLT